MAIYLDNAATSYPKPEPVWDAVDSYNRHNGAPAGRGTYANAVEVQATLTRCRKLLSDLFNLGSPQHVAFTFNCTDSLNTVFHGVLKPGDHVVTSAIEHNSVRRPLNVMREQGIDTTVVPVGRDHRIDPVCVREAMTPRTRLVAVLHASNVSGVVQPIDDIGEVAREHDALMLLDAAQTAGQYPIDMERMPVDLLCAAGHKSLLGPLGTGVLCVRPGIEDRIRSFRQGGTGSLSEKPEQPQELPDRFEAGNLNMPGIFGLTRGLEYIQSRSLVAIREHEQQLMGQLCDGLAGLSGVTIHGRDDVGECVSVLSLTLEDFDPHDAATVLDQSFGIRCRAGLHCAPGAHEALGTLESGGTIRLSPGVMTTEDEIAAVIQALRMLQA